MNNKSANIASVLIHIFLIGGIATAAFLLWLFLRDINVL